MDSDARADTQGQRGNRVLSRRLSLVEHTLGEEDMT